MKIIILTDYKNHFETKYSAVPYRSGFDKKALKSYFSDFEIEIEFKAFSEVDFENNEIKNQYFLYTSSEDKHVFYKGYIEDVVYGIHLAGGKLLPGYKYLKAHHNKVFMEVLRSQSKLDSIKNIKSKLYGTYEDFIKDKFTIQNPTIVKPAEGSMSKGVSLHSTLNSAKKAIKNISKSQLFFQDLKDYLRRFKHQGYITNSKHRKKFITQNYVENLKGDWKILIYGDRYYVLSRENRKNDFRASGGGNLSYSKKVPQRLLDFSQDIFKELDVPNLSIDIGLSNDEFYLIEFQALFFGTYTLEHSEYFFKQKDLTWNLIEKPSVLEKVYAESIHSYINNQNKGK